MWACLKQKTHDCSSKTPFLKKSRKRSTSTYSFSFVSSYRPQYFINFANRRSRSYPKAFNFVAYLVGGHGRVTLSFDWDYLWQTSLFVVEDLDLSLFDEERDVENVLNCPPEAGWVNHELKVVDRLLIVPLERVHQLLEHLWQERDIMRWLHQGKKTF